MDVRLNSEDKTNLKRLGRKIKTAREAMHLSQEKLAKNTGLNRRTISRIENADVNPRCTRSCASCLSFIFHSMIFSIWDQRTKKIAREAFRSDLKNMIRKIWSV